MANVTDDNGQCITYNDDNGQRIMMTMANNDYNDDDGRCHTCNEEEAFAGMNAWWSARTWGLISLVNA